MLFTRHSTLPFFFLFCLCMLFPVHNEGRIVVFSVGLSPGFYIYSFLPFFLME